MNTETINNLLNGVSATEELKSVNYRGLYAEFLDVGVISRHNFVITSLSQEISGNALFIKSPLDSSTTTFNDTNVLSFSRKSYGVDSTVEVTIPAGTPVIVGLYPSGPMKAIRVYCYIISLKSWVCLEGTYYHDIVKAFHSVKDKYYREYSSCNVDAIESAEEDYITFSCGKYDDNSKKHKITVQVNINSVPHTNPRQYLLNIAAERFVPFFDNFTGDGEVFYYG